MFNVRPLAPKVFSIYLGSYCSISLLEGFCNKRQPQGRLAAMELGGGEAEIKASASVSRAGSL